MKYLVLLVLLVVCIAGIFFLRSEGESDASSDSPVFEAFQRAVLALEKSDRDAIEVELRFLKQQPDTQQHVELISAVLMVQAGDSEAAMQRLERLEFAGHPELESYRSLFLATAMVQLERTEEAESVVRKVLDGDPGHPLALRMKEQIKKVAGPLDEPARFVNRIRPTVERFCGDCHATPLPDRYPKSHWAKEVRQGFELYELSGRQDLIVPAEDLVLRYFQSQAPEQLDMSPIIDRQADGSGASFSRLSIPVPESDVPAVAHVNWVSVEQGKDPVVLWSDMRSGVVGRYDPANPSDSVMEIAKLDNPCHTTVVDLNEDGRLDLLVSELGSFLPEDHRNGRVVYLRATESGQYETQVLASDIARVSDIQPGDFDEDGDLDLVVAEFGWRTTGRILLLINQGASSDQPTFEVRELDPRHGTIHVPVIDINSDGHLDFIALISQDHESIVAFLNDGKANFTPRLLFDAKDPSFGSSGIQLTDLDQDGDVDVLYSNGDTFDSDLIKPYHGVQWLENKGNLEFEYHHLMNCFGAYRAVACDVENDGDLDVMVVAALPVRAVPPSALEKMDSIVCLINDGQQNFSRQVIEQGCCYHVTCDVGDIDQDGDLDLITGRMSVYSENPTMPMIDLWRNERTSAPLTTKEPAESVSK